MLGGVLLGCGEEAAAEEHTAEAAGGLGALATRGGAAVALRLWPRGAPHFAQNRSAAVKREPQL